MAMSRIIFQSLFRSSFGPPAALAGHHRHRSSKSRRAQLIDVAEVDQADSAEAAAEVITLGIRKLEDAIHSIIVRRSAPDWLPFLPGYSYWVPPRASAVRGGIGVQHPAGSMVDSIGRLAASGVKRDRGLPLDLLSEDENLAFTSSKGWPASSFYIEGTTPVHPIPVVEVDVKIQDNEDPSNCASSSEDEEE